MIPARGPQTVKLSNHCSAIFTVQSLLCDAFCNMLLKIMKNQWLSFAFASRALENNIKHVFFIFC